MAEKKKQLNKKQQELMSFVELLKAMGFDVVVVEGDNLRAKKQ